jgi:hypothetical protein
MYNLPDKVLFRICRHIFVAYITAEQEYGFTIYNVRYRLPRTEDCTTKSRCYAAEKKTVTAQKKKKIMPFVGG